MTNETANWIFWDIVFWVVVFLILHYYNSDDEPRIKEEPKKVLDENVKKGRRKFFSEDFHFDEDESYDDFIDED